MRRLLILSAILGICGSGAFAAPLCLNDGSLQFYINNYNTLGNACQIGDKLFWGFGLAAGPNSQGFEPAAADIQVQPLPGDGLTNIGIDFNSGGWVADPGFPIDNIVTYSVTTLSGLPLIHDATLIITGTLTGLGASGSVTETLTPAVAGSPLIASLPSPISSHIDFSGNLQTTFFVKNEINLFVDPRNLTSTAHISVIENDFSEVVNTPEPALPLMIGSGLCVFGLVRRKMFSR